MASRRTKILLALAAVFLGLPVLLVLAILGGFYAFFYYPNDGSAIPGTIAVGGQQREFLLYVPQGYQRGHPAPLVVSMHAAMSWPSSQMAISQWNKLADAHGFLVAYPAGLGDGPKTWFMRGREQPATMPDVLFASALIDKLAVEYSIDKRRIYADGLSNGGGMAFVLACTMPDRITAIGLVAAARSLPLDWCTGTRPVPMIAFHGTADPVTPYRGGRTPVGPDVFPDVEAFSAAWAKRNGCDAPRVASAVAPAATQWHYGGCPKDVVLVSLQGAGHQWPGGKSLPEWLVGPYSREVDATARTWAFFSRHAL